MGQKSLFIQIIPANVHTSYLVRFGMGGVLWDRSLPRPVGETARLRGPGEVDVASDQEIIQGCFPQNVLQATFIKRCVFGV